MLIRKVICIIPLILATIENESDRAFLSNLYIENYEAMRQKAKSMLYDDAAVEDAIQDTFVYFAKNLDKVYRVPCRVLPFFVVMCIKRKCIDYMKKQKTKSNHIAGSIDDADYHFEFPDSGVSTEDRALLHIDVELIKEAFSSLPDSLRDILQYKYLLEMSDKEIAELLGIKESSVRKNLTRARRAVYQICEEKGYVEKAN